jgi:hypothetical protein
MRNLTLAMLAMVAGAIGCGGEKTVYHLDKDGKVVGSTDTSPEALAKHRSGELVVSALVWGDGAFTDCDLWRDPFPGETTFYSAQEAGGDCNVAWANNDAQGYGSFAFGFDSWFATWLSTGVAMNDTVRSYKVRSTANKAKQSAWSHNTMGSNGIFTYRVDAGGGVAYWPYVLTSTTCPPGQNCPDGPMSQASWYGMGNQD